MGSIGALKAMGAEFNFNKCCIWIPVNPDEYQAISRNLTLTSVVFE